MASEDTLSLFGNADPLVGKALMGRWEILEFLGEGSMSSAYRARDRQSGGRVVIKMLHHHLVANNKNLKRFEQRAKGSLSLTHDKIGRVLDVQLTPEGSVFLVVEELQGESLEDLLAKSGHLSADQAVDVFIQVCEGLEYAHEQDVLHRDLKPSNIVLLESGGLSQDVKLVDFGIAKLLSEESDDVKTSGYITRTREVFGSPMYMSPEQCMGKKLDGRSDVYSLGCVMYETLTGKPPFVGKNVLETAYKHMNEAPKPFASDRPGDRALVRYEAVIFKCLSKDPNERYQSVSQLKTDLEALPTASEADWVANANALKKSQKAKKRDKKKFAFKSVVSFEIMVFVGASLLLAIVVGVWSFSFLGAENQDYPAFNNDSLWVVKEKKQPNEVPDFGSREEAARMDVATEEKEKPNSREYATAVFNLCKLYLGAGHWADAALNLHKLIEVTKKVGGPVDIPTEYAQLSYAYFMQGENNDAEIAATNAMEEAEKAGLNSQPVVLLPLKILGDIYSQKNELDKATEIYEKLYNVVEPRRIVRPNEFMFAAVKLGDIYRRQDKLDYAERYYRQAIEVAKSNLRQDNMFTTKALYGLGLVLAKEGNNKEAEDVFREALPVARKLQGPRSAIAGAIRKELQDVLWKANWVSALTFRISDQDK